MLGRLGAWCLLILFLNGPAVSPLAEAAEPPPSAAAELAGALLRLDERDARPPGRRLLSREVVEALPDLARVGGRQDAGGPPVPRTTPLLLRELERLARRVIELEAELGALGGRPPAAPLVRITVARHE